MQDPPAWPDPPNETPHLVNGQPDCGIAPAAAPRPGTAAAGAGLDARRPPFTYLRVLQALLVISVLVTPGINGDGNFVLTSMRGFTGRCFLS